VAALFVPGWGARASLYRVATPPEWEVLDSPLLRRTGGRLDLTLDWLRAELQRRPGPVALAGHSFGAALAVIATARQWVEVERLVLLSPAGPPLTKPIVRAGLEFARQFATGTYPLRPALASAANVLLAPLAALQLAREIYSLDLRPELEAIRRLGIPVTVLNAVGDTLTSGEACREIARLAGGTCEELDVPGGHVWFLRERALFRERLAL